MERTLLHESIDHLTDYPSWRDGFPVALAEYGREMILRTRGLDLENYGTARMVHGRPDEERDVRATLQVPWGEIRRPILVESLPREVAGDFERLGLRFADAATTDSLAVIETLEAAVGHYIIHMPGLAASVASLSLVLHVLVSEHDDYDTSHSDPTLPFSVFVSVPTSRRADGPLRVVESIVHETMHLQLSLLERIVPLINPTVPSSQSYSPWRGTYRDAGGILHALYVFRVIDQFWGRVVSNERDAVTVQFANSRRAQIEREIREVADFQHCSSLTRAGSVLVGQLLKGVGT
jgi:HEXXH motif-containing protein